MAIYIILLISIFFVSCIDSKKFNRLDLILFSFMALISGFRYNVGVDYFNYVRYFELVASGERSPAELSFDIISKIIISLGINSQGIFLIYSILTLFFYYLGIKYHVKLQHTFKPVLYIIFFLYTFNPSLNAMRQYLAASIILFATRYIIEKKLLKYLLWVFVAMQFHYSSIIMVLLYIFICKEYKKSLLAAILTISYLISYFRLVNKGLEIILRNYNFLDVGGYISRYLYSSFNSMELSFGLVFHMNLIILFISIFIKDRINKGAEDALVFNMFYLYGLSSTLSMGATVFQRVMYFFSVYAALFIPKLVLGFDLKSRVVAKFALVSLYTALFIFIILTGYFNPGISGSIPYDYRFDLIN